MNFEKNDCKHKINRGTRNAIFPNNNMSIICKTVTISERKIMILLES